MDDVSRLPDGAPARPPGPRLSVPQARKLAVAAGLAGYSWIAASAPPFSRNALLAVLLPGAVLAVFAYGWPPERIPAPDRLDLAGASYWAICIAALFEWEAAAFRDNSPWWHPSLTDLVSPLISPHPVKAGAIFVWLLAGWALVRR